MCYPSPDCRACGTLPELQLQTTKAPLLLWLNGSSNVCEIIFSFEKGGADATAIKLATL